MTFVEKLNISKASKKNVLVKFLLLLRSMILRLMIQDEFSG